MSNDLLILDARVRTLAGATARLDGEAGAGRVDSAMLVRSGRVVATGDERAIRDAAEPGVRTVGLGGRTVLPGFIDAHTHVELTTLSRHFWTDVRGVSREAVLDLVRKHAQARPPGAWAVFQGTFGQDLPDRRALDAAAPRHPVAVRWSMHKFVVNQAALDASGITESTVPPAGVRLQRDPEGRLNGVVEEGWDLVKAPRPEDGQLADALHETLESFFLRRGVTTVHEIVASHAGARALQALAEAARGPRIGLLFTVAPGHQALAASAADVGLLSFGAGRSGDRSWVQGLKIFLDGGRDGAFRSAIVREPAERWGLLTRLYPTLVDELVTATERGMQVCTHAIGDLAQEIAVSAIEQVNARYPGLDHRLRVEHFFNESFGTATLERLVAAGGIAVPNPGFVFAEPDDPGFRLPAGARKYALRTLQRVQGLLPGNSDTAGAQPFTTNPWFTMQCMLRLRNRNGLEVTPGETVDRAAALRAFTVDAAYATFQEHEKGSLEPGKLADFSVVDRDPFAVAPEDFAEIETLATVIGGQRVWGRLEELP